jgi:hypothetical protein
MIIIRITFVLCALLLISQGEAKDNKLHSHITTEILPQTYRIKEFQWEGKKYWIKKLTLNKIFWLHRFGRELGSVVIPISFLKPTPYGNKDPLELEKERLLKCEQLKVNCPRLVDYGTDWLALTDAGVSAEEYFKTLPHAQRFKFILKLIKTILHNQKKGFFHGRYYLRDMLVSPTGQIFSFDLEEDPTCIMRIPDAKAREIFHFIVSACTVLDEQEIKHLGFWLNEKVDQETKKSLLILKDYKKIIIFLDFFKDYLGRDSARFLKTAFFIMDYLSIEE